MKVAWRRWWRGLSATPMAVAGIVAIAVSLLYVVEAHTLGQERVGFLSYVESRIVDLHYRLQGPRPVPPGVRLVAIDEASVAHYGRWPWPRSLVAAFVRRMDEAGARAIGFDVLYTEEAATGELARLRGLRAIAEGTPLAARIDAAIAQADEDADLAVALADYGHAVLPFYLVAGGSAFQGRALDADQARRLASSSLFLVPRDSQAEQRHFHRRGTSAADAWKVQSFVGAVVPIPRFVDAAGRMGFVTFAPDPDGIARHQPLLARLDGRYYTPLAVALAREAMDATRPSDVRVEAGVSGEPVLEIRDRAVPLDWRGRMALRFYGGEGRVPTEPFVDVMAKDAATLQADYRDAVVILGATDKGIGDFVVTPTSPVFPGPEVHATALLNLLHEDWLTPPTFVSTALAILGLCLALGAVLPAISPFAGVGVTFAFALAWTAIAHCAFRRGVWLEVAYPILAIALVYVGTSLRAWLKTLRERDQVKDAFQHYLAPAVVKDLVRDPGSLRLGGEVREITVFFSDVADFTTISESLAPQALVSLMSAYLGEMTDIILESGGTLDKYIGDAIMAFWNAPIDQGDHARRAALAAIACQERLAALRRRLVAQGQVQIHARVGLHSGPALVGNMGSRVRFNYTAMGDTVNLASRLEGANKAYGTRIMVSEATLAAAGDAVESRELDLLRVKGKLRPVAVYEVLGRKGEVPEGRALAYARYTEALAMYRAQGWEEAGRLFGEVREAVPDDGPARVYMDRCRHFAEAPPGPGWDGVYVMSTK